MSYQFKDRFILESLFGKSRSVVFNGTRIEISQVKFKQFIEVNILYKRLLSIVKYKFLPEKIKTDNVWIDNPRIFSDLGLDRIKRTTFKRVVRYTILRKKEFFKAKLYIKRNFGIWLSDKDIFPFMNLINIFNTTLFRKKKESRQSVFSRTFESWAYNLIDVMAHDYGWEIDYILNLSYVIILELTSTANNRKISDKVDQVSASISGNAGADKVYDSLQGDLMKRRVNIPIHVLIENDRKQREELRNYMGNSQN